MTRGIRPLAAEIHDQVPRLAICRAIQRIIPFRNLLFQNWIVIFNGIIGRSFENRKVIGDNRATEVHVKKSRIWNGQVPWLCKFTWCFRIIRKPNDGSYFIEDILKSTIRNLQPLYVSRCRNILLHVPELKYGLIWSMRANRILIDVNILRTAETWTREIIECFGIVPVAESSHCSSILILKQWIKAIECDTRPIKRTWNLHVERISCAIIKKYICWLSRSRVDVVHTSTASVLQVHLEGCRAVQRHHD